MTHPGEGRTEEYPTLSLPGAPADPPSDAADAGEDDLWPSRGPARGIRLSPPAAVLLAVLLAAGGFWGGAYLQKHRTSSSSGSAVASAIASRLRAAANGAAGTTTPRAGFGAGAFGGGSSAVTAGTISVVDGKTVYVLGSDGALVKVTLGASTTITRDAKTDAGGLRPGDTVIVQGSTSKDGTVTAASVSATAPGVGGGGRGFGGGGGFGRSASGAGGGAG